MTIHVFAKKSGKDKPEKQHHEYCCDLFDRYYRLAVILVICSNTRTGQRKQITVGAIFVVFIISMRKHDYQR